MDKRISTPSILFTHWMKKLQMKLSLQSIYLSGNTMWQIARWYDVEVSYEGGISKDKFTGEIDRNITLAKVLDNLARSRVHFRIEGKKLIQTP